MSDVEKNYGNLSDSQQYNHTAKFKIIQVGVVSVCFEDTPSLAVFVYCYNSSDLNGKF
jgi:hypothetical protein